MPPAPPELIWAFATNSDTPCPAHRMQENLKFIALLLLAILLGILFLAAGVGGVVTGGMSRHGYSASGLMAGRTFGCALIFGALAWFRFLWLLIGRKTFDLEDGPTRLLALLAGVCVLVTLPLLFFDVAF